MALRRARSRPSGVPIDQMSFLEDGGHLNVLLRDRAAARGMLGSEATQGSIALLRVPLSEFGDGRGSTLSASTTAACPAPQAAPLQNRFVGDWLLWGGAAEQLAASAWALRYAAAG